MPGVPFPMAMKWAIVYHKKGGARFLDLVRIYGDATWDHHPFATINLDNPLVLLSNSPKDLRERPSHLARACDLLPSPELYLFMAHVENHIIKNGFFKPPGRGLLYVTKHYDQNITDSTEQILAIDFDDALTPTGLINFDFGNTGGTDTGEVITHEFRQEETGIPG